MSDHRARLYLVTPALGAMADMPPDIVGVLKAGDVACILLRLKPLPDRDAKDLVKQAGSLVQPTGTALLVEDARIAAHAGADGVHVSDPGAPFADALGSLKPERIVGIGGRLSRDDAMRVGEMGADYILFGDDAADAEETLETVGWWAEIFNVPCVGYARTLTDIAGLGAAGAEFVALGDAVWHDPRGPAAAVAEAQAILVRVAADASGAAAQ